MTAAGLETPVEGQLGSTSVGSVLLALEARRTTCRVVFETDLGKSEVDIYAGGIVDAYMGDLIGRSAILKLLAAESGKFSVLREAISKRPPIVKRVADILDDPALRVAEWRRLCAKAPPLSSILVVSERGRKAIANEMPQPERSLLQLFDGQRMLTDVIDESGLDAVDALRTLLHAVENGFLLEGQRGQSLFPLPGVPAGARPRSSAGVYHISSSRPPVPTSNPLRKRTSIGIGIPAVVAPSSRRAPAVVPTPIISVTPVPPNPVASPAADPPPEVHQPPAEPTDGSAVYVDRYQLLLRIARGGMGSVYLCRLSSESGFRRIFALKLLRSHLLEDRLAASKFIEEARLAGHVHHPHVVSVVDAGIHGSQPYLVMDYIEGGSLHDLLDAHPTKRPPALLLPIIIDALAGLHAVHTALGEDGAPLDIIHCDVSPENLLVGVDGTCRLSDLGVARHRSNHIEAATHGKPRYLAPEQVLRRRVDRRSDIFSMGVVLYNSLTGTYLFDAPTPDETLRLVCSQRIEPPSTIGLRPPPSLDFVCMRALDRDPDRRFQTAEEMMLELRRIALREDMLAPTASISSWVRESVGNELAQRRLAVFDATREMRASPTGSGHDPEVEVTMGEPDVSDSARGVPDGTLGNNEPSQTISLPEGLTQGKPWALIIAAGLAAMAVLATMLWPAKVSKLFKLNTQGVVSRGLQTENTDPPAADAGVPAVPSSLPLPAQETGTRVRP